MQEELQRLAPTDDSGLQLADLFIRTKLKTVIPFTPNAVQRLYLDMLLPEWERQPVGLKRTREILLKARQHGFSTLILALFFLDTITTPHTSTVVIAHDAESTERLFQIVQRFYKSLPEDRKPRTKYANRREYLWPDLDSTFYVGQAGSKDFGRSSTINNVHMSEVGSWTNGEELVSGLLQAVPADGNVFAESTAKGLGNWFHSEFTGAERGASVFTARFFGWHEHEEYREDGEPLTPTEDEEKLVAAYRLDTAQLRWRRTKLLELKGLFPQEYPANPREAFLTSGNPYFDRVYLAELSDLLQGAEFDPVPVTPPGPLLRREVGKGLSVWAEPQAGRSYIIGADTAEGLTDDGEADFDSADVFDAETWEQVAHLHGKWDTHEYGLMLAELGFWYNTALLGVERNNHGHAVINAALHTANYPPMHAKGGCSGLYFHQEYDETKKTTSQRPGWPTTPKTKYFALDGLATSLDSRDIKLRSRHTVSELLTFVKLPGGKAGGEGKCHDDAVTSCAIADALLRMRPRGGWFANRSAREELLNRGREKVLT